MRAAVLRALDLRAGLTVVDATVGAGGHAADILEQISPGGTLIGIDRDPMMLAHAKSRLESSPGGNTARFHLSQGSYVTLPDILAQQQISHADRVLADLGLSSDQLADEERGFRFDADGPLDMRFDSSIGEPAYRLLESRSADELATIFREYGEERHSDAISRHLVIHRKRSPIRSARELADAVTEAISHRPGQRVHPATRVFQALRIAVNRELTHVAELVDDVLPAILHSGGRAAVITFHSLEDRLVKNAFRRQSVWEQVSRKPVTATPAEQRQNPRSRSAKLRVAMRK
jgi:16S rRNA (cytosine1402-N4)-methyltransferase